MIRTRRTPIELGRTAVLAALADRQRRRVLKYLRDVEVATVDELASELARFPRSGADPRRAGRDGSAVRAALEHRHLPKLADAGLISRRRDRISIRDHPTLENPVLVDLLDADAENVDDVLGCLSAPRRLATCAVLAGRAEPLPIHALARRVVQRVPDLDDGDVERCCTELHHVHLPKLAAADLIERTDDGDRVRYRGHPVLEEMVLEYSEFDTGHRREEPLT